MKMITAKEAKAKYNISRMALYLWANKGLLTIKREIRPDGKAENLYDEEEVARLVKNKGKYKPSKNENEIK